MRRALGAFAASLALAASITVGTAHLAGAEQAPNVLQSIHALTDAAVLVDAQSNYSLPVTSVDCRGTGPQSGPWLITDAGVACYLYGPNGWTAVGSGVIVPTLPGQIVTVGMVYWPVVNGAIDGRI